MNIFCDKCSKAFFCNAEQVDFITKARAEGMTLTMLECQECFHTIPHNPQGSLPQKKDVSWRTPISGISGFVSFVETGEMAFYGCGETGVIWESKEKLFEDIALIIKKYPHRQHFYYLHNEEWLPKEDPLNAEKLIFTEEKVDVVSYVKG